MDEYVEVNRRLAEKYGCFFVDFQRCMRTTAASAIPLTLPGIGCIESGGRNSDGAGISEAV